MIFQDPIDEHKEMLDMLRRRHEIYCGLKGKEANLIAGNPPGMTDCESFISIPFEDARADLVHKHEWQHWFFKTDLRMRAQFVARYAEKVLMGVAQDRRNSLSVPLENFLHYFTNAIDDLRVNSLWGTIYPHSSEELEARWKVAILSSGYYQTDFTFYVMGVGLGISDQMGNTKWSAWEKLIEDNVSKVRLKSFPAVLLAARCILDEMIKLIVGDLTPSPNPPDPPLQPQGAQGPPQASPRRLGPTKINRRDNTSRQQDQAGRQQLQLGLLNSLTENTKPLDRPRTISFMDTPRLPAGPDMDPDGTKSAVAAALGVGDPDQVLRKAQIDIDRILASLKSVNTKSTSVDQHLLKGMESYVVFRDVEPKHVDRLELGPQDKRLVEDMKTLFARLMNRKKRTLSESGSVLDPRAYADMLMGGDVAIFEEEVSAKGFDAILLIDMSGSMLDKWNAVNRATKVLASSMKFPFVRLEVWGFTGQTKVSIFRFKDKEKGFFGSSGPFLHAWALTPLSSAVEIAIRKLLMSQSSVRHLFLITDGLPTSVGGSRERASTESLMEQVARSLRVGAQSHVRTTSLVVGDEVPNQAAELMFGGTGFWCRVDDEGDRLFDAITAMVRNPFLNYLRK